MSCYKRVRSLLWREIFSCPAKKRRVFLTYPGIFVDLKETVFRDNFFKGIFFYEFNFLLIFWKANLVF